MCLAPKVPKPKPAPASPSVYNPTMIEVVDQAGLDANNRQRRRLIGMNGRQSTILAGRNTGPGGSAAIPPTSGTKTLTGA